MTQPVENPPVLALVRDLMFSSKITAEGRAAGVPVVVVRDPGKLIDQPGRLLLVDCNMEGAIAAGGAWRARTGGRVIGFVSHVDTEAIRAGREAGFDQVVTRGQFVGVLPTLIRQ